jgi:hypothetical protein
MVYEERPRPQNGHADTITNGSDRRENIMSNTTKEIERLIGLFDSQFMKPEIYTRLTVSQIDNKFGESRFAKEGEEYLEKGETITSKYENACLCRLSASGYTDCTDWELCHDENDILEWLSREAEDLDEGEIYDSETDDGEQDER